MKLWLKIVLVVILVLLIAIGGLAVKALGPRAFLGPRARTLTSRTFESTPVRLERGKYLVEAVLVCNHCHSPRDWTKHDAPVPEGLELSGQDLGSDGFTGHLVAPNLTPDPETGSGKWTDDMLARSIREGIGHDGRALFPLMPYEDFKRLPDEDVASIVVYLRSLPPVHNSLPKSDIKFPVKYVIRNIPQPIIAPIAPPDLSTPVQRGAYLVSIIGCSGCHTPSDSHDVPLRGMEFGGGVRFEGPWGKVASANLTPDATGIPYYDQAFFIHTLRTGYAGSREINCVMPWWGFRNMTDDDLAGIFAYLKSLKPVRHRVDNSLSATRCPLDGGMHGAGDQNIKQ